MQMELRNAPPEDSRGGEVEFRPRDSGPLQLGVFWTKSYRPTLSYFDYPSDEIPRNAVGNGFFTRVKDTRIRWP